MTLARKLVGKIIVHRYKPEGSDKYIVMKSKIVETEAYMCAVDSACHAYKNKKTDRTKYMFNKGGHVYVFVIYGMYKMLNITAA